jgi:hypothetical protein
MTGVIILQRESCRFTTTVLYNHILSSQPDTAQKALRIACTQHSSQQ